MLCLNIGVVVYNSRDVQVHFDTVITLCVGVKFYKQVRINSRIVTANSCISHLCGLPGPLDIVSLGCASDLLKDVRQVDAYASRGWEINH